jgi:hypothetical protein
MDQRLIAQPPPPGFPLQGDEHGRVNPNGDEPARRSPQRGTSHAAHGPELLVGRLREVGKSIPRRCVRRPFPTARRARGDDRDVFDIAQPPSRIAHDQQAPRRRPPQPAIPSLPLGVGQIRTVETRRVVEHRGRRTSRDPGTPTGSAGGSGSSRRRSRPHVSDFGHFTDTGVGVKLFAWARSRRSSKKSSRWRRRSWPSFAPGFLSSTGPLGIDSLPPTCKLASSIGLLKRPAVTTLPARPHPSDPSRLAGVLGRPCAGLGA